MSKNKKSKQERLDTMIEDIALTVAAVLGIFIMDFLTMEYDIFFIKSNYDFVLYSIGVVIFGKIIFHIFIKLYYHKRNKTGEG